MGATKPFFINETVLSEFDIQEISANKEKLAKYGFKSGDKIPEIYAAIYMYKGKRVLLVRNASYHHSKEIDGFLNEDYMKHYRALLDQWDNIADVLIVDQTHNGGGSYCQDFFRLFINEQKNAFVQRANADRAWIRSFLSFETFTQDHQKSLFFANAVEQAIDKGEPLSEPLDLLGGNKVGPDRQYTWKKPLLVLTDELAASCADVFPMLIKRNNVAKLFGQRTVGAGGNVEPVGLLRVSGAEVVLTRGLFTVFNPQNTYSNDDYVENNGITPDYMYEQTIEDARGNFVDYVKAFSEKALEQI